MIRFGIRQSFDRIEQVEERYSNLNVPVEIAMPYYWDIYEPVRRHLAEIAGVQADAFKIDFPRDGVLSGHGFSVRNLFLSALIAS